MRDKTNMQLQANKGKFTALIAKCMFQFYFNGSIQEKVHVIQFSYF